MGSNTLRLTQHMISGASCELGTRNPSYQFHTGHTPHRDTRRHILSATPFGAAQRIFQGTGFVSVEFKDPHAVNAMLLGKDSTKLQWIDHSQPVYSMHLPIINPTRCVVIERHRGPDTAPLTISHRLRGRLSELDQSGHMGTCTGHEVFVGHLRYDHSLQGILSCL